MLKPCREKRYTYMTKIVWNSENGKGPVFFGTEMMSECDKYICYLNRRRSDGRRMPVVIKNANDLMNFIENGYICTDTSMCAVSSSVDLNPTSDYAYELLEEIGFPVPKEEYALAYMCSAIVIINRSCISEYLEEVFGKTVQYFEYMFDAEGLDFAANVSGEYRRIFANRIVEQCPGGNTKCRINNQIYNVHVGPNGVSLLYITVTDPVTGEVIFEIDSDYTCINFNELTRRIDGPVSFDCLKTSREGLMSTIDYNVYLENKL